MMRDHLIGYPPNANTANMEGWASPACVDPYPFGIPRRVKAQRRDARDFAWMPPKRQRVDQSCMTVGDAIGALGVMDGMRNIIATLPIIDDDVVDAGWTPYEDRHRNAML
jgi:hypothetical protein